MLTAECYRTFTQKDGTGGNPTAVLWSEKLLSDETMQAVAAELGVPDTAFAQDLSRNECSCSDVSARISAVFYTPDGSRVPLCGHASLAVGADAYRQQFADSADRIVEHYQRADDTWDDTQITQGKQGDIFFESPVEGESDEVDSTPLLAALGVEASALDTSFKPVKLDSEILVALRQADFRGLEKIDHEAIREYLVDQGAEGTHVFALSNDGTCTARCRNFAPVVGINEEKATGSATGKLLWELRSQGKIVPSDNVRTFIQGEAMGGVPGLLRGIVTETRVWVGGAVQYDGPREVSL